MYFLRQTWKIQDSVSAGSSRPNASFGTWPHGWQMFLTCPPNGDFYLSPSSFSAFSAFSAFFPPLAFAFFPGGRRKAFAAASRTASGSRAGVERAQTKLKTYEISQGYEKGIKLIKKPKQICWKSYPPKTKSTNVLAWIFSPNSCFDFRVSKWVCIKSSSFLSTAICKSLKRVSSCWAWARSFSERSPA